MVTGKEYTQTFKLTILPVNDAPYAVLDLEDHEMKAGDSLLIILNSEKGILFDDPDSDDQFYLSVEKADEEFLPGWITFENDSLFVTPTANDTGCVVLKVIATDLEGLKAISTFNLCVSRLVGTDIFEKDNLKVYPNPTTGKVYVDFINGNTQEGHISVLNVIGEIILQKTFKGETRLEIDLSNHVSGFYYLRIRQGSSERVFKLILTQK